MDFLELFVDSRFTISHLGFAESFFMNNTFKYKYHLKIFLDNVEVQSLTTKKKKRIIYKIQEAKKLKANKFILRVSYSQTIDVFGKRIIPINEGEYFSVSEFMHAWRCFNEK